MYIEQPLQKRIIFYGSGYGLDHKYIIIIIVIVVVLALLVAFFRVRQVKRRKLLVQQSMQQPMGQPMGQPGAGPYHQGPQGPEPTYFGNSRLNPIIPPQQAYPPERSEYTDPITDPPPMYTSGKQTEMEMDQFERPNSPPPAHLR